MPLLFVGNNKIVEEKRLLQADILKKVKNSMKKVTYDAIVLRLRNIVSEIDVNMSGGYTVFGMIMGDQSYISKADHKYIWDSMEKVFGNDVSSIKKALGTMLMWCFATDHSNWLCIMDPDKQEKMMNGQIPDSTQYFIDSTGKGYAQVNGIPVKDDFENSLMNLAKKFNRMG